MVFMERWGWPAQKTRKGSSGYPTDGFLPAQVSALVVEGQK
jgi:hypothetical protein